MNIDGTLRAELISSLFGQLVKPFAFAGQNLSLDEFHLSTIVGNQTPSRELFLDEATFFDPWFDYDFTQMTSSETCSRGNEPYSRPLGWYRLALKVRGKYPDGDTWLGPNGWRSHSVAGEWPVSYHGTSFDGARGIIREHFKAGERDLYGRGIYSTPDVRVAEAFARFFRSPSTGKTYKVIMQNRINPAERKICKRQDYWLIPVASGTSAGEEANIVTRSIRPYGILIKQTG